MALLVDQILKQVQAATAAANPSTGANSGAGGAGKTVYSATAVTIGSSYDSNVYDQVYGQTDQYTGYRNACDAAKDLKDHGEGMYDRRMMDSIHNVKHNVIDNQDWRVDVIEEDKNGDGTLDENDAESKALLDAIVDSFDSELDLYIENKLQEVIDTYGPSCSYNLRAIFGSPNSPAVVELAKLGIRADGVGDHDAWQNRTYAFSLVDMSGLPENATDEEILAHVYAEDAEILQDANGKKGSMIFADCLTADGVAGGAEMNLSSILDQMGYECVSKADFLGNKQGFDDLIANIQTGLDNDLYKSSGQTINDKYGRTLTIAQAVCAVYGINGHAYGNKGWHCKARSFEQTLNAINELGDALYKGGNAVKGVAKDFGTGDPSNIADIESMSEEYASLMEKMESEKDPEVLKQYEKEAQDLKKKIEEKSANLSQDEEKYVSEQFAKQQEQNFNDAVDEAQKAVDKAIENGEDPTEVLEKIAKEYDINVKDIQSEIKY